MLEQLPLPAVIAGCQQQTECFRRDGVSDPRFCHELWRRAIDLHDADAWKALVEQYSGLIRDRLQQAGLDGETIEEALQQTFVSLWLKSRAGEFSAQGRTLAEVLQYLSNRMRYSMITVRRQQHALALSEGGAVDAIAAEDRIDAIDATLDAQALFADIRVSVQPVEWRVLQLRYMEDLPPREIAIVLALPVEEIYVILADVKRRLRARPDLQQLRRRSEDTT
jgi:RNA polymerase sigma factor (sigma-70 family)